MGRGLRGTRSFCFHRWGQISFRIHLSVRTPQQIHSDQGKEFESQLFQKVCQKLGTEKTHTTPYRPQSDGLVERYNATLQRTFSMLVNENRNDWDDHLPYVLMAYRASVQESTK